MFEQKDRGIRSRASKVSGDIGRCVHYFSALAKVVITLTLAPLPLKILFPTDDLAEHTVRTWFVV